MGVRWGVHLVKRKRRRKRKLPRRKRNRRIDDG